jgi:hypothetical protein
MANFINTGNKIEKFRTGFQLIGISLLSVVVIPLVLYLLFRKRVYDQKVVGKIIHVAHNKCASDCEAVYEYNQEPRGTALVPDNKRPGDFITVYYDPENPEETSLTKKDGYSAETQGKILYLRNTGPNTDGCKEYTVNVKETKKVNGVSQTTHRTVTKYICHLTYEYTVKGKKYFKEHTKNTGKRYNIGDDINVYYESKNPGNSQLASDDYRVIGGVISSVFSLIVLGLSVHYFMVSRVRGYGSFALASRTVRSLTK